MSSHGQVSLHVHNSESPKVISPMTPGDKAIHLLYSNLVPVLDDWNIDFRNWQLLEDRGVTYSDDADLLFV